MIKTFINPEGYQNRISGLKVTAILLKGWILPIGESSAVEGLRSTGLPRLVFRDSEVCLERYDSYGDFGYLTKKQTFIFEEKFVKEHIVLLL